MAFDEQTCDAHLHPVTEEHAFRDVEEVVGVPLNDVEVIGELSMASRSAS